jgi:hypothetical protein
VICPFLAAMMEQGALPIRRRYGLEELFNLTVSAGVPEEIVFGHVDEGNFKYIPTAMIDLFDMEGNVNEHQTSTGIFDCRSTYRDEECPFDCVTGAPKCKTEEPDCRTPGRIERNVRSFWEAADANRDGAVTGEELDAVELVYADRGDPPTANDRNEGKQIEPLPTEDEVEVEGTLAGSYRALLLVFGEECDRITEASFRDVVQRNFPPHYRFPSLRDCRDPAAAPFTDERRAELLRARRVKRREDLARVADALDQNCGSRRGRR